MREDCKLLSFFEEYLVYWAYTVFVTVVDDDDDEEEELVEGAGAFLLSRACFRFCRHNAF